MWFPCFLLVLLVHISIAESQRTRHVERNSINLNKKTIFITNVPENCVFVTSETGYFIYNSTTTRENVCGIYFITDPGNVVEVNFIDFDVPCNNGSKIGNLVQYLDGWELNGEVFPSSTGQHQSSPEVLEFCSNNKPDKTFVSSQNGALISYRIPEVARGFSLFVKHKKQTSPCNIIHTDEPNFIIKNYGKRLNCSIWAPYPVVFKFNSYSVGNLQSNEISTSKCSDSANRIEIGGGGLDTNQIEIVDSICNKAILSGEEENIVLCSTATIKLVSDGTSENFLNVSMRLATQDEILHGNIKYQCKLSLEK